MLAARSSAYDVDLQDIAPPTASFTLLSGSFSVRFARINAGVTERHTYSLTPKVTSLPPATSCCRLEAGLLTITVLTA